MLALLAQSLASLPASRLPGFVAIPCEDQTVHSPFLQVAAKLGITGDAPAFAIGRNYDDFGIEAVPGAGHKAFEGARCVAGLLG